MHNTNRSKKTKFMVYTLRFLMFYKLKFLWCVLALVSNGNNVMNIVGTFVRVFDSEPDFQTKLLNSYTNKIQRMWCHHLIRIHFFFQFLHSKKQYLKIYQTF